MERILHAKIPNAAPSPILATHAELNHDKNSDIYHKQVERKYTVQRMLVSVPKDCCMYSYGRE